MSAPPRLVDFDDWLAGVFERTGAFTMLIVLVEIGATSVDLAASSYLHVIGDATRWPDMTALFAASGARWNGAAFFQADRAGLVDDATAGRRLAALGRHLAKDRSLLNEGAFFNAQGLRLKLEEIAKQ
ncbi:conserved hypothetical protein [Methylocella silvestris BL2]|uniref:Uncharacterized protein n=1 Tax=Methylocella silvestris (strain DSM 15510 / CIP 108128 / LMG 27833 / NCIMB 13906 / BL2) TaxID=395965 RepID=B8ES22_METSB|nr:hypothetical protein [Methylocella silvestris]ACK52237.1 conserved hypothetical protein [Methylocella silvestris BL2]